MTPTNLHLTDELAQRYVDGVATEAEAVHCTEHLAGCDGCSLLVESYRALGDALEGLGGPEPEPGFTAAVMARIDGAERAAARSRRFASAVVAAAAVLLVAVLGVSGAAVSAPALSGLTVALGDVFHATSVGLEVAAPLLRALRLQIVVACVSLGVPLLLALRRLSVREAEARVSAS
jgi:anti-sigma factor RsiW